MPNMLVHFAVQGIATRSLIREFDIRWVFLGCVIPDIPWILQRALRFTVPNIDPYSLRLYAIAQASFAVSVLLSGAFSLISKKPRLVFLVLVFNSFLHFILDACETKWGNGVHLFAPLSWDLLNFGLVWPESLLIYLLTAFGLAYTVWMFRYTSLRPIGLSFESPKRMIMAMILFVAYCFVPLALLNGPLNADNHSVKTLQEKADRIGRDVYLDRNLYVKQASGGAVRTFAGEELRVVGEKLTTTGTVSIQGAFVDSESIVVHHFHYHQVWLRNTASYIGLLLFVTIWIISLYARNMNKDSFPLL